MDLSDDDEFDADTPADGEAKACLGCFRVSGVDRSFLTPDVGFSWLYGDGRGEWCKDCAGIYKIYFKGSMTLGLFGRWLKTHRTEYLGVALAYLTLKSEGVNRVARSALEARLNTLKIAFALAGVPYPLAAVAEVGSQAVPPAQQVFVPMAGQSSAQGPKMMALVPRTLPSEPPAPTEGARFVTTAQAKHVWPIMPAWTASPDFVAWWNSLGTDIAPEVSTGAAQAQESSSGAASAQPPPASTSVAEANFTKTFTNISTSAKLLLFELNTQFEPKTKERDFSPVLVKLLKLRQELVESPAVLNDKGLMDKVDQLIEATSAAKRLMRPYREYRKNPKVSLLAQMSATSSLAQLVKFLAAMGQELGPWIGSCDVKASFFQVAKSDPTKALQCFQGRLAYNYKETWDNCCAPDRVVVDCLTSIIYDNLKENLLVETSSTQTQQDWATRKQCLAALVKEYCAFASKVSSELPEVQSTRPVLEATSVVCHAALQKDSVGPDELLKAIEVLESSPHARRLKEGFKVGLGAAVMVDAKEVFAVGELDAQCESDMLVAGENILGVGVEHDKHGIHVAEDSCVLDSTPSDLVRILSEAVVKLREAIEAASARKLAEEMETLCDMVEHIPRILAIYDAARVGKCFEALAKVWKEWEEVFCNAGGDTWPPSSLKLPDLQDDSGSEDIMLKLCNTLAKFREGTLEKLVAKSPTMRLISEDLRVELERVCDQIQLRQCLWAESVVVLELLKETWQPGDEGVRAMLGQLSGKQKGFFGKIIELARLRVEVSELEYCATAVISMATPVTCGTGSSGNEDASLAPYADTVSAPFFDSWKKGRGVQNVLKLYLYDYVEGIVQNVLDKVASSLECVPGEEQLMKSESHDEPLQELQKFVPMPLIGSLGNSVDLLTCKTVEVANFLDGLQFPSHTALVPLLEVLDCCYEKTIFSKVLVAGGPMPATAMAPCLRAYDLVACVLQLACSMTTQMLQETSTVILATKEKGMETLRVAPTLATCFQWVLAATTLTWPQTRDLALECAPEAPLLYPVANMDHIINFVNATWLPTAMQKALRLALQVVAEKAQELRNKTPAYAHIITATKYNSTLAKKQLLAAPVQVVGSLIEAIGSLVSEVKEVFELSEMAVAENATLSETDGVMEAAKLSMSVIAAVTAIESFAKTAQGPGMARQLLDDKKSSVGLPEVLRQKLRAMVAASA